MTNGSSAAAAGMAAAIKAVKAIGTLIEIDVNGFKMIVQKQKEPVVVMAEPGFLRFNYRYLTPYKGLNFYTFSKTSLRFGGNTELIKVKRLWVPSGI
ncbi:MAG: hypothetical protein HOI80_03555 [Alphaproteobacteria bacterium]|jgi:hypothetical protein|nr:hypothetical protein [Alphaproteobacteria bacterium]MBT5389727.1 hypothetical protein [Alphaproteobacteria bacterium]MBT5654561.1 hypothetical protein [Alphaproteobacteria bacterium]